MVGTVRHLHTALMHMYCYAYKHDQRNKEHILPDKLGRLYREDFKIGDWRKHAGKTLFPLRWMWQSE